MHHATAALLLIATISAMVDAAEKSKPSAAPAAAMAKATPREAALEHLLSERESPAALQHAIEQARKRGLSEQVILEARFLFHVDRHEDDAIIALLPEFTKRRDSLQLEDSEIFATKEDWLAVNEFVVALAALKKGDTDAFKQHITEAFWLSPRQGAVFAPYIDRLRLEAAMRSIKFDFTARFVTIHSDPPDSLKNIVGGRKALLLHFWSPWSNESVAAMPDFIITAKALTAHDIAVVSILADGSANVLTEARASLKALGAKPPGAWLLDENAHPLKRELRVQTLPTMVLIATDGRILFNGHPAAAELWIALRNINPAIRRPALVANPAPQ